jgi:uncharacterized membrane protein
MKGGTRLFALFLVGFSVKRSFISVVKIVVVKALCTFKWSIRIMLYCQLIYIVQNVQ